MNLRTLVNLARLRREDVAAAFNLEPEEYLFFLKLVLEDLGEELTQVEHEVKG